ncbi:MAG: hypothetical protein BWZ10_00477 [candidate division BRC1 bacterium ADurb.BinA364]|nr:MAG: hypothetical protein BWZ10_00477 [candidate division BRC1 bacterium ADurb.BinA364]
MRFRWFSSFVLVLGLAALAGKAFSNGGSATDDGSIGISVSPQTMLLGSDQGGSVVVHTNIAFRSVDASSLDLNGIKPRSVKADARGELVAYFNEGEVKGLFDAELAPCVEVMTLSGMMKDGTAFSGSDTVRVIVCPAQ